MPSDIGDNCECCKSRQETQGQPVRKLVALPALPGTIPVPVCEWCDEPAIKAAEATIARHAA